MAYHLGKYKMLLLVLFSLVNSVITDTNRVGEYPETWMNGVSEVKQTEDYTMASKLKPFGYFYLHPVCSFVFLDYEKNSVLSYQKFEILCR